jgi:hypothetical protein
LSPLAPVWSPSGTTEWSERLAVTTPPEGGPPRVQVPIPDIRRPPFGIDSIVDPVQKARAIEVWRAVEFLTAEINLLEFLLWAWSRRVSIDDQTDFEITSIFHDLPSIQSVLESRENVPVEPASAALVQTLKRLEDKIRAAIKLLIQVGIATKKPAGR